MKIMLEAVPHIIFCGKMLFLGYLVSFSKTVYLYLEFKFALCVCCQIKKHQFF